MARPNPLLSTLLVLVCERAHAQTAAESFSALEVPGYGEAVVSVPGDGRAHPVVVASHGNYDRPEWQCGAWSQLVRGRAFVLCPRGIARRDSPSASDVRFTYRDGLALGREIDAGLVALRAAYGERIAAGPIVYAGFSLGAIMGTGYVRRTREQVAAVVMIEGGHDGWTAGSARSFAQRGGRAVLFGCGQGGCANDARRAVARMRGAPVETAVTLAPRAGHSYGGVVWVAMREAFERLIAPTLAR
jgi:pimeloyl-ACP methyl ester carboxylesterase